jgi:hypothetical protein
MTVAAAFAQRPKAIAANNILFHMLTSKVNPGLRIGGGFLEFGRLVQREQAIGHQVEAWLRLARALDGQGVAFRKRP